MRASHLIGCQVYTSDGVKVGTVHDLRFETSGRVGTDAWRCRLTGIACASSALGHRLGYGAGDMAGPWPLSALMRRRFERRRQIDWADVDRIEMPRLTLRVTRRQLDEAPR